MITIALSIALFLLTALAVLQLLVGLGLPLGRFVWGGSHRVLPQRLRIASLFSIPLYAGFALLLLSRAGTLPGDEHAAVVTLTWVLFAYFAFGTLLNAISRSSHERWTMSPTSGALAITTLVIAIG